MNEDIKFIGEWFQDIERMITRHLRAGRSYISPQKGYIQSSITSYEPEFIKIHGDTDEGKE